ncbi:ribbon-helix-helix protein, CopG family [Rhizobium alarense]|uniref:ribbon-helix-helix protein, CopG family n=1 Tax=Rhizobium alarense TaxID=2846851 RepID=UPI0038B63222
MRLSKETLALLDQQVRETKRSRSFLVEELLKRHLKQPALSDKEAIARKIECLRSFKGIGARLYGPLTEEEIERRAREFGRDVD